MVLPSMAMPELGRILAAALLTLAVTPAAADECAPWPGEPEPLPSTADLDPLRARWASLRIAELTERARILEAPATLEAHLLWRRILCLDPTSETARRSAARTRPLRVHRPVVVVASGVGEPVLDPWSALATRVVVRGLPPAAAPRAPNAAGRAVVADWRPAVEGELDEIDRQLRTARFEDALASARATRARLDELGGSGGAPHLQVRLELLAATAEIALERDGDARASLLRALDADPELEMDPASTSPKVLRALEAARAARRESP